MSSRESSFWRRRLGTTLPWVLVLLVTAAVLGLAACGGGEEESAGSEATEAAAGGSGTAPTEAPPTAARDDSARSEATEAPPTAARDDGARSEATEAPPTAARDDSARSEATEAPSSTPAPKTVPAPVHTPASPTPWGIPAESVQVTLAAKSSGVLSRNEHEALLVLQAIKEDNLLAYDMISGFPFLADGVTDEELIALSVFQTINERLAYDQTAFQSTFEDLDWFQDGITFREARFLEYVSTISDTGLMVALLKTGSPTEDAPEPERVDLLWAQDDLTHLEWRALIYIQDFREEQPEIAEMVMDLPWLNVRNFRARHLSGITSLSSISQEPDIARTLLEFPWMQDDNYTEDEQYAMRAISRLAKSNVDQARSLLNAPLDLGDKYQELHPKLLYSVSDRCFAKGAAQTILDQPWFNDGITHDEVVLSFMLGHDKWLAQTAFGNLADDLILEKPNWMHDTFSLPGGDVNLYLLSREPLDEAGPQIIEWARTSIETLSAFMGNEASWPYNFVVIMLAPDHDYDEAQVAGVHFGSFVMIRGPIQATVYHEMAHYYHMDGPRPLNWRIPKWLVEGWAEFSATYTLNVNQDPDLERAHYAAQVGVLAACGPMKEEVTGVGVPSLSPDSVARDQFPKIQHLLEATIGVPRYQLKETPHWACHYPIGENFLLEIYRSLGPEVVASAFREMYRTAWFDPYVFSEYDGLTDEEMVYKIFLDSTPPEKQDQFVDLYQRLHGGPPTPASAPGGTTPAG